MAIVQTLTKYAFIDAFKQSSRKDQFSYEALEAIFEYLESYSEDSGEPVEFDIVGICCDWCEAEWKTIAQDYNIDLDGCSTDGPDECIQTVLEYLEDNTQVIELSDGVFVYAAF